MTADRVTDVVGGARFVELASGEPTLDELGRLEGCIAAFDAAREAANATPTTTIGPAPTFSASTAFEPFSDELVSVFRAVVDSEFESASEKAGMSVAVFDGLRLWAYATGVASEGRPMTATTPLQIQSVSKTFLGALITSQVAEGLYALDSTLLEVLGDHPSWDRINRSTINEAVTVDELLGMRSGHGHISANPDSDNAITSATDWTPLVYTDNLIDPFGPSGTIEYKDTDPYLLGLIAEHHGGDTLNRLYADRFFLPLGIEAGLIPQDDYPADMAHPYGDLSYYAMSEGFGDIVEAVWWMDHFESRKQAAWALTGIVSTPEDVARWAWELFSPSGTAVTPAVRSTLLGSVPTESIRLGSNLQR